MRRDYQEAVHILTKKQKTLFYLGGVFVVINSILNALSSFVNEKLSNWFLEVGEHFLIVGVVLVIIAFYLFGVFTKEI